MLSLKSRERTWPAVANCCIRRIAWRDKKLATDWSRLLSEVRHWEGFARLEWSEDDVDSVARYLNTMYYRYAAPD